MCVWATPYRSSPFPLLLLTRLKSRGVLLELVRDVDYVQIPRHGESDFGKKRTIGKARDSKTLSVIVIR